MKQMRANYSDIFGSSRTYSTRQYSLNNRPSMISAKYRQKEERRKVLKTSINKLKKIDDPETSLCRSVLINNTMKKLQDETKNEKLQKQQFSNILSCDRDEYLNSNSKLVRNHASNTDLIKTQSLPVAVIESYPNSKQTEETDVSATNEDLFSALEESSNCSGSSDSSATNENSLPKTSESRSRVTSRKRSFSDMDDCNVQDVLSHFCLPPTPTMLTCIDDHEDVTVCDDLPKRVKKNSDEVSSDSRTSYQIDSALSNFGIDDLTNKNKTAKISRFRHFSQTDSDSNSLGCAHAFLFGELRNNNYQNLITSLES